MAGSLVEVVFIGHFHDRRGHPNLCATGKDADCDGFVVDGIRSVGGENVPASTLISLEPYPDMPRHEPVWTPADVDRLLLAAAPDFEILSRVALPGHRIRELEPALGTGALGIIDRPIAWVVTGLDAGGGGAPVRRTFLLVDNTAEAYETVPWDVDNVGFVPFTLVAHATCPDHRARSRSISSITRAGTSASRSSTSLGFSSRPHPFRPARRWTCQLRAMTLRSARWLASRTRFASAGSVGCVMGQCASRFAPMAGRSSWNYSPGRAEQTTISCILLGIQRGVDPDLLGAGFRVGSRDCSFPAASVPGPVGVADGFDGRWRTDHRQQAIERRATGSTTRKSPFAATSGARPT